MWEVVIGPGKYDKQLSEALKKCGAKQGILVVIDGKDGPSFCSQLTLENILSIPDRLRFIADQISKDFDRGKL